MGECRKPRPVDTVLFAAALLAGILVGHSGDPGNLPVFGSVWSKVVLGALVVALVVFHRVGDKRFYIPRWSAILYFMTWIFLGDHLWP